MNMKNKIAVGCTVLVSAFLLFLWYALGFNHVDAPLDLVVSIIWWCGIAALAFAVKRAEDKRRYEMRTLYVTDAALFNPETGMIEPDGRDQMEMAAEVLDGLSYGFKVKELSGHMKPNVRYVVHTDEFADKGDTWKGSVIVMDAPDYPIDFSDRYGLACILSGQPAPACAASPVAAMRPVPALA